MRNWLKELRDNHKLSQMQIAEMTGITQNYYSNIENDERRPSPEVAKRIAEVLHFNWTKFYEDKKEEVPK